MKQDAGVILVNVLVVLAIGATVAVLMLTSQQTLLERTTRSAAAAQAEALALGAETSVVLALQRDMQEAPEADHYQEPWNAIAQAEVALATGAFSVTIVDAQSRFNLNALAQPGLVQSQILQRLTRSLDLPDRVAAQITRHIAGRGAIQSLEEISALDQADRARLAPFVTALPVAAPVNLNTANATVIGAIIGNPAAARQLVKTREATGFLTQQDLRDVGVLAANGAGFTSQFFEVTSRADVDDVSAVLLSQIARVTGVGISEARVISRTWLPQPYD